MYHTFVRGLSLRTQHCHENSWYLFIPTSLLLGQLTKVHRVHGVGSRKPKIILVTILETELISRKPKRIE